MRALIAIVTFLLPRAIYAQEKVVEAIPANQAPEFFSGAYLVQVFLSLLVVIALMFAVLWGLRRFNGVSRGTGNQLQVVASVGLGQREKAVLINAGNKQILVGVAPGAVRTLHVFDQSVETGLADQDPTSGDITFGEVWKHTMGRRGDQV